MRTDEVLFAGYDAAGGLVCGEDQDFGYLHVLGSGGGVVGYVSDVVTGEGLYAFVDRFGLLGVAMEANLAKLGFDQTRLEVGDSDSTLGDIYAESVGDSLDGSLGGAIDIALGVGGISCHTADIDDMPLIASHHAGHDKACHGEQALDVGIDHSVPIFGITLILPVEAESETGIVDKHVDLLPLRFERLDGTGGSVGITNIEHEALHASVLSFEAGAKRLKAVGATGSKNQVITTYGKASCAGLTDATGSAGNKSNLFHDKYSVKII